MKFVDLRSHLRSVTSLFSVAVASGVAVPAVLYADDTTGSDGSVSIRLLLEPSSPQAPPEKPISEPKVASTVIADEQLALPAVAPKSLVAGAIEKSVAGAVEKSQSLDVRQPLNVLAPRPAPKVLDLDAELDRQVAQQGEPEEPAALEESERTIDALPVATPARRFLGRRSQEAAKSKPTSRTARRPSHSGAEPAPLPPGHDVLSLESGFAVEPSAKESSRDVHALQ